jgi:hypothetical protein
MEATYSISTLIKSNHAGEEKALVYVRVTVSGERAEISIKRTVDRDRWDAAANRVRGNKEDAREINALLDATTLRLNKIYNKMLETNEHITAKRIKEIYFGKDEQRKTLLEAFTDHNQKMASRVGVDFSKSTYTRYSTTKDHIKAFLKHQYNLPDIQLRQLRYPFITDLEHFLKVIRKCNHNSTLKYIRNFRKIINLSVKNDWLDKDPFKAYQVKLKDTRRTFLNKEELTRLEEKTIGIERLDNVRDVFVFCCYTGWRLTSLRICFQKSSNAFAQRAVLTIHGRKTFCKPGKGVQNFELLTHSFLLPEHPTGAKEVPHLGSSKLLPFSWTQLPLQTTDQSIILKLFEQ